MSQSAPLQPAKRPLRPATPAPAEAKRAVLSGTRAPLWLHIGWAMVSGRLAGRHAAQAQARSELKPAEYMTVT